MRWPFKSDDWIAFFLPGALMLLGGVIASTARSYDGLAIALGSIYLAIALSVVVGFYLTKREASLLERWMVGALFGVPVFIANAAVAFVGCSATGAFH